MRKPIASDKFYIGDPVKLYEQVNSFLFNIRNEGVKVAVVPHAGYIYSGKCAGKVYSMFKGKADTIILLGPNHTGIGNKISFSFQSFLIPFGKIDVDLELGKEILKKAKEENLDASENEEANNYEHSLEVQLPFLKTILDKVKIAPIILKEISYEDCLKLSKVIYSSAKKLNRKIKVIISSDFTHYGEIYNFIPFKENIKENLYKLDKKAIDFILNLDSIHFYDYALANTTICGMFAITVGIELAKLFECKIAEKVCYFTSGELMKDYTTSVSYAGIVFK